MKTIIELSNDDPVYSTGGNEPRLRLGVTTSIKLHPWQWRELANEARETAVRMHAMADDSAWRINYVPHKGFLVMCQSLNCESTVISDNHEEESMENTMSNVLYDCEKEGWVSGLCPECARKAHAANRGDELNKIERELA